MTSRARQRARRIGAVLVGVCLVLPGSARSQGRGCTITPYTDPPREELSCPDGFTLSAERGSLYRLLDRNRDGRPEAAELSGRGLLVDAPARRGAFQIRTPHAIASVRGTVWAVDVTPARTSVFVRRGAVSVSRPSGPAVTLRDGDGVDVEAGTEPLAVKRWSPERAAGLLARFGR
ncbi:conserved hypothetical protein [Methylobacterium sp. 4-46]|uniref:FecR domain-containing protein n=1 Tax=unclassified Methylobacterium TaxID=2615210 RepID=UPI000165C72B|nr:MULTISPECIES: FecR family protein [Methylobacterium]ACA15280.1 conserved hypothetical protein [Methylobacterium sp. 4-46]WFT81008.1 FecR family protein [Methylobacterium nodulans]